jgi:hypothetical protein
MGSIDSVASIWCLQRRETTCGIYDKRQYHRYFNSAQAELSNVLVMMCVQLLIARWLRFMALEASLQLNRDHSSVSNVPPQKHLYFPVFENVTALVQKLCQDFEWASTESPNRLPASDA